MVAKIFSKREAEGRGRRRRGELRDIINVL